MSNCEGRDQPNQPADGTGAEGETNDQKHMIQPLQNVNDALEDKRPDRPHQRTIDGDGRFQLSGLRYRSLRLTASVNQMIVDFDSLTQWQWRQPR